MKEIKLDCMENEVLKTKIGNCKICGNEFKIPPSKQNDPKRGKYCSRKCSDKGRRKGWFSNCVVCNSEFWVFSSRPDKKTCSRKCQWIAFSGENHPRHKEKIRINCLICNKEFPIDESDLGHSKYCSNNCRYISSKGRYEGNKSPVYSRVDKKCPVCGIDFTVKKSQDERCKDNCCCREHTNIWASISRKFEGQNNPMYGKNGESSPAWKGGKAFEPYSSEFNKELKEYIKEKHDCYCQICGEKFKFSRLDVHHADYNKLNNDESNLFPLCKPCHGKTLWNRKCWEDYFKQ